MSSGAEKLPQDASVEVVALNYNNPRAEEHIEDIFGLASLSELNQKFIEETAKTYGVSPSEVIDAAVESYKDIYELTENGGKLFVLGRDGNMHPLGSDGSAPAA